MKEWKLIDGETVAIDSFKIRARNSLKNNFNDRKLKQHIEYIDKQIKDYETLLDTSENEEERKAAERKLAEREEKKTKYTHIQNDLKASGEEQISVTDADARSVILHRNIVNVGYNIQASSDSKYKLLVEYDTGDVNDAQALAPMTLKTKELLKVDKINVLADKGYHTGNQMQKCAENNITTFVSPGETSKDNGLYPVSMFTYVKESDTYTCPIGSILQANNTWHQHSETHHIEGSGFSFRRYLTKDCKTCPARPKCTVSKHNERAIDRAEHADYTEANAKRVNDNPDYYRKRQQVAEHMYGTLKRQRGFTHTNLRGKEKVLGETGLFFIGYNLTRCITILGVPGLIKALKECCLLICRSKNRLVLSEFGQLIFKDRKIEVY